MALKIRLRPQGRRNRPFYRLVLTEERTRRDGKYHEFLGWYDPLKKDNIDNVSFNSERILHWLEHGAEMSENVEALLCKTSPEIVTKMKEKALVKLAKAAEKRKQKKK